MEATQKNYRIAEQVITLLANENCTVRQSAEILSFVGTTIQNTATVQLTESLVQCLNSLNDLG